MGHSRSVIIYDFHRHQPSMSTTDIADSKSSSIIIDELPNPLTLMNSDNIISVLASSQRAVDSGHGHGLQINQFRLLGSIDKRTRVIVIGAVDDGREFPHAYKDRTAAIIVKPKMYITETYTLYYHFHSCCCVTTQKSWSSMTFNRA